MGLLSKIFNTDKLAYILREEEEFSVTAPKQWNVETLTVGDTITPDMFKDNYRFYDFDLYIKEIGWDDEYEHDDIEGSWYVTTKFDDSEGEKKYGHNQFVWWLHELNDFLKPQYQVFQPLFESKEDEFNVKAPQEWNVEILSEGDTITPDMWISPRNSIYNGDKNIDILEVGHDGEGPFVVLQYPEGFQMGYGLEEVNENLKPQYKIFKSLSESEEDEFNVDAPEGWNTIELGVGDKITPDMWKDEHPQYDLSLQSKIVEITDIGIDDNGPYVVLAHKNWSLDYDLDIINNLLKSQYKIEQNLTESEEDFNVDAPAEWDVTELKKGDYIMPDMWVKDIDDFFTGQSESKYLFKQLTSKPIKITGVMRGDELYFEVAGLYFILTNDFLLPQYKVVGDFGMYESNEDEFNVDAPPEWDVIELSKGDIITPDMWNDDVNWTHDIRIEGFKKYRHTNQVDYMVYLKHLDSSRGSLQVFDLGEVNDWLKNAYRVEVNGLIESEEDEFNVDAPSKWNVTEIGIGDYIYPEMINVPRDKRKWNHYHNILADPKRTDGWQITEFKKQHDGRDLVRLEYNGVGNFFDVDLINSILKQYRIFPPTNETKLSSLLEIDDEFTVEAPPEWDNYLTIGDTVTPDMWDDEARSLKNFKDFNTVLNNSLIIKNLYPQKIGGDPGYLIVFNDHTSIHSSFLDPKYIIDPPLNESDDEFSVDAPLEWNQESLSTGDIITPDMWDKQKIFNEPDLNGIKVYNDAIEDSWIIDFINYEDIDNAWFVGLKSSTTDHKYFGLWSEPEELNNINNVLKDNYKIYPPNTLLESDDEEDFSVDAPENWNVTELGIGSILDSSNLKMQDPMKKFEIVDFKVSLFPWETNKAVLKVFQLKDEPIPGTNRTTRQWKYIRNIFVELKILNDRLKDNFKIIPSLRENEEEDFSVEASPEWNVTELTIGDYITPDMWDEDSDIFDLIDDPNEDWLINVGWVSDDVELTTETGGQVITDINNINTYLKPQYRIVKNKDLFEEEEDFSVDAPQEWNIEYLTTGDTIIPDMWDQSKIGRRKDFFSKPIKIDSIGYNEFDNEEEEPLVGLDLGDTTTEYDIDFVNYLLKPTFKVVQNKNLTEEEDFNVDAPAEWDQHELKVGDYFNDIEGKVYTHKKDLPKDSRGLTYEIVYIGPNEGEYHRSAYYDHNIIAFKRTGSDNVYSFTVEHFNRTRGPKLNAYINLPDRFNLNEDEEDFSVDAPKSWNINYLNVGDTITPNMWNKRETKQSTFDFSFNKPLKINWIGNDGIEDFIVFEESDLVTYAVEDIHDLLKPEYRISLSNLQESEEDFNVDALPEWDIIELKVGDYINSNMLNPKGNDYTWFSRRKLFIEDIYFDECWTVNLLHVESGYHTPFCIDYINEDVLNDKYRIMTSLNELLEIDDEFDVEAPQKWDVIELGVGDKITKDMIKSPGFIHQIGENFQMDFPGVITKIYKSGPIDDDQYWGIRIKFKNKGWKKYLPQSEDVKLGLGLSLDDFNEDVLKPQYQIQKPVFELSTLLENEEDFNVNAPDEWNVELLTVGDTVTPEMWGYEQINSWFDISKPLTIEDIGEDDGGWWVQLGRNEAPFDLDEVNEFLKPQYKIVPYNLEESDDEFNIDAPEEWNYDYWEPTKGMRDDEYYKSFDEFVTRILRKYGVEDEFIEIYLDEVFNFGDFTNYEGISSGDLYEDFQQWIRAQDETSEWYDDMNEEEDFSVDAPEDWWEYDGDVELMFQDTYWYEDENGKEAIVERDGGGIVNINDLEQYSYSDWKPFTGNPTSENLTKWYYSINWDTDLVEMFDFDDSLFEVEEDFDWSTAENVDMDRTGFKIRAVSTLKEADDEFTVKAPQKWDIVYLNKGDFLDNTNSTFNDPNVKYEIGNITSDGEIEVKKYINRGSGFEPQFDRFMKTRKGIVKAKLKPGFDIEMFSK